MNNTANDLNQVKVAVLYSGGLDSSVLLYHIRETLSLEWSEILAIIVYYGQKHSKECKVASDFCAHFGIPCHIINLATIFKYDKDCTLLQDNADIPHEAYKEGEIPSTYVPFRNGLFLSVAASVAIQTGARLLFYGAHMNDAAAAYPDCSEEFVTMVANAVWIGSGRQLELHAPFINMTKADIVKKGLRLEVPFHRTWSCYEGKEEPCGICATCIDRAKAFAANGFVEDGGRLIAIGHFHK